MGKRVAVLSTAASPDVYHRHSDPDRLIGVIAERVQKRIALPMSKGSDRNQRKYETTTLSIRICR